MVDNDSLVSGLQLQAIRGVCGLLCPIGGTGVWRWFWARSGRHIYSLVSNLPSVNSIALIVLQGSGSGVAHVGGGAQWAGFHDTSRWMHVLRVLRKRSMRIWFFPNHDCLACVAVWTQSQGNSPVRLLKTGSQLGASEADTTNVWQQIRAMKKTNFTQFRKPPLWTKPDVKPIQ